MLGLCFHRPHLWSAGHIKGSISLRSSLSVRTANLGIVSSSQPTPALGSPGPHSFGSFRRSSDWMTGAETGFQLGNFGRRCGPTVSSMAVLVQPASPSTTHCGQRPPLDLDDSPWPPMPPPNWRLSNVRPPTPRPDRELDVQAPHSWTSRSVDANDPDRLPPSSRHPALRDLVANELMVDVAQRTCPSPAWHQNDARLTGNAIGNTKQPNLEPKYLEPKWLLTPNFLLRIQHSEYVTPSLLPEFITPEFNTTLIFYPEFFTPK